MKDKGTLVVISGFSGAGKGTVSKALVEKFGYSLSVSATTRQPREGEQDGREYYFKSEDDFLRLIDYNGFIEYAQYVDHYYGTPRKFVEDELAAGHVASSCKKDESLYHFAGDAAQRLACCNRSWCYEKIFDPRVIYFPAKSF